MSKPRRKRSALAGAWVAHSLPLRLSPAWCALPDNARRALDRLEVEHMQHGGAENGNLAATYDDFEKAGVERRAIALALDQCIALGFVERTHKGGLSRAGYKHSSRYRLTYLHGTGNSPAPSDEWKQIRSPEVAATALAEAKAIASKRKRAAATNSQRPRSQKRYSSPSSKTATKRRNPRSQNCNSYPGSENATAIYISDGGGDTLRGRAPKKYRSYIKAPEGRASSNGSAARARQAWEADLWKALHAKPVVLAAAIDCLSQHPDLCDRATAAEARAPGEGARTISVALSEMQAGRPSR